MRFSRAAYLLAIEIASVAFDYESVVVKECFELCWEELSLCERGAKGSVGIGGMLEVHHDRFDLRCRVVAEVLAISVPQPIAGMGNSTSAIPFGRVAAKAPRVRKQDVESESTGAS